jgi:hypothetical protein
MYNTFPLTHQVISLSGIFKLFLGRVSELAELRHYLEYSVFFSILLIGDA